MADDLVIKTTSLANSSRRLNILSRSNNELSFKKIVTRQVSIIKQNKKRKSMHQFKSVDLVSKNNEKIHSGQSRIPANFLEDKISPTGQLIKELSKPKLVKTIYGRRNGSYDGFRDLKVSLKLSKALEN